MQIEKLLDSFQCDSCPGSSIKPKELSFDGLVHVPSYCYSRDDCHGPGRYPVFLLEPASNLRNVFYQDRPAGHISIRTSHNPLPPRSPIVPLTRHTHRWKICLFSKRDTIVMSVNPWFRYDGVQNTWNTVCWYIRMEKKNSRVINPFLIEDLVSFSRERELFRQIL